MVSPSFGPSIAKSSSLLSLRNLSSAHKSWERKVEGRFCQQSTLRLSQRSKLSLATHAPRAWSRAPLLFCTARHTSCGTFASSWYSVQVIGQAMEGFTIWMVSSNALHGPRRSSPSPGSQPSFRKTKPDTDGREDAIIRPRRICTVFFCMCPLDGWRIDQDCQMRLIAYSRASPELSKTDT